MTHRTIITRDGEQSLPVVSQALILDQTGTVATERATLRSVAPGELVAVETEQGLVVGHVVEKEPA